MDVTIDDKGLAMTALKGLPPAYESLIVVLDAFRNGWEVFSFNSVKCRLLQEEQWAIERDRGKSTQPGSFALGGINSKPDATSGYVNLSNYRCKNWNKLDTMKDIVGKRCGWQAVS